MEMENNNELELQVTDALFEITNIKEISNPEYGISLLITFKVKNSMEEDAIDKEVSEFFSLSGNSKFKIINLLEACGFFTDTEFIIGGTPVKTKTIENDIDIDKLVGCVLMADSYKNKWAKDKMNLKKLRKIGDKKDEPKKKSTEPF